MGGISEAVGPRLVGSRQQHLATVLVELERGVELAERTLLVAPDDEVAVGRDGGRSLAVALADLVFLRILRLIAEVHTFDVDGLVGGVVELYPVLALEVVVDVDAVVGTYLVDTDRGDALGVLLAVAELGERGGKGDAASRQADGAFGGEQVAALLPAGKTVAGRCLGTQGDGCEEVTFEVGVGDVDAVNEELGTLGVGLQCDRLACGTTQLHGRELLHVVGHRVAAAAVEVVLDGFGCPLHIVSAAETASPSSYVLHQLAHPLDVVHQFVDNLAGTCSFEDATANDAVGVDELAAELVVLQQVQEQVDDVFVVARSRSRSIVLELLESGEGVIATVVPAALEGVVEVEADETVASVVAAAVGLDVVVGPVVVVEVEGDGHVVGELINVEQRLQLLVGSCVGGVLAQFADALDGHVVAVLHRHVLEGVELLVVVAPVGVGEVVVVRLAQVEDTTQLAVHIFYDGHVRLHIDIDARALDDGLKGGVHEAGVVGPDVVAAIAYKQCLVTNVGLLWEESVVELILSVEYLVGLQLERAETL